MQFDDIVVGTTTSSATEQAIRAGAARRRWTSEVISPEVVRCRLDNRQHVVVVDVHHTENSISVKYVSSVNMNYDAAAGTIHRKYNAWVKNLIADIKAAANGAGISTTPAQGTPAAAPEKATEKKPSPEERLKKLGELREKGLINDQEYEAQRKEILGSI